MILEKHTVNKPMPKDTPLLALVRNDNDIVHFPQKLIWVTGCYTDKGWILDNDNLDNYTIIEYYVLPDAFYDVNVQYKTFSQKLRELEDFWNNV